MHNIEGKMVIIVSVQPLVVFQLIWLFSHNITNCEGSTFSDTPSRIS